MKSGYDVVNAPTLDLLEVLLLEEGGMGERPRGDPVLSHGLQDERRTEAVA